jgi:hypothetical protein
MRVRRIEISGIGGITSLELTFKDGINLLCGPNGVGKTTVLECIGHSFSGGSTLLLPRNVKATEGSISISTEPPLPNPHKIVRKFFHPGEQSSEGVAGYQQLANQVLILKTNRTFEYQTLGAIARDPQKDLGTFIQEASRGIGFQDIKNWLVLRECGPFTKKASLERNKQI